MAITTLSEVKILANMYDLAASGVPGVATVGQIGDIYLDTATGLSYVCTKETSPYEWAAEASQDARITLYINKSESDYLLIRGIPYVVDDNDAIVYPDNSNIVAAEMVCYLMKLGPFQGRGKQSESIGGASDSYDKKIYGYDTSIVGSIDRFHSAS